MLKDVLKTRGREQSSSTELPVAKPEDSPNPLRHDLARLRDEEQQRVDEEEQRALAALQELAKGD